MKTQIELLVQLQSCDSAISKAQRIQDNHPREIKRLEETLEKSRAEFDSQAQHMEEIKKKRISKEQDLALEEEKVQKARQRLATVKTNKEYQASLKEIEAIENSNTKIEEEILFIMEEADALIEKQKQVEEQFKLVEKEIIEEKKVLEAQLKECSEEIEAKQSEKERYLPQIKDDVLNIYHRVKRKRPEFTVVPVENSCCMGCHMNIPPQLFNEVKTCEKIIACPHCSRILYWKQNHETLSAPLQPEAH